MLSKLKNILKTNDAENLQKNEEQLITTQNLLVLIKKESEYMHIIVGQFSTTVVITNIFCLFLDSEQNN